MFLITDHFCKSHILSSGCWNLILTPFLFHSFKNKTKHLVVHAPWNSVHRNTVLTSTTPQLVVHHNCALRINWLFLTGGISTISPMPMLPLSVLWTRMLETESSALRFPRSCGNMLMVKRPYWKINLRCQSCQLQVCLGR